MWVKTWSEVRLLDLRQSCWRRNHKYKPFFKDSFNHTVSKPTWRKEWWVQPQRSFPGELQSRPPGQGDLCSRSFPLIWFQFGRMPPGWRRSRGGCWRWSRWRRPGRPCRSLSPPLLSWCRHSCWMFFFTIFLLFNRPVQITDELFKEEEASSKKPDNPLDQLVLCGDVVDPWKVLIRFQTLCFTVLPVIYVFDCNSHELD